MKRGPDARSAEWVVPLPAKFAVGEHELILTEVAESRWRVAVDGREIDRVFGTQAEAWEAGVQQAMAETAPSPESPKSPVQGSRE